MPQTTALAFFSSHITALRRLTELGLFFAEQMAASTQAPLDGLTDDPVLREAASAGWVPLKSIAAQERGFSRLSAGIRGNIEHERRLLLTPPEILASPEILAAPEAPAENPAAAPDEPPDEPTPTADPPEEPAPTRKIPTYLLNEPEFDDTDLARLGRCWKGTAAAGLPPFRHPAQAPPGS